MVQPYLTVWAVLASAARSIRLWIRTLFSRPRLSLWVSHQTHFSAGSYQTGMGALELWEGASWWLEVVLICLGFFSPEPGKFFCSLRILEKRLKVLGSEMESVTVQVHFLDNPASMKIFAKS